jgi:hypothetical protein
LPVITIVRGNVVMFDGEIMKNNGKFVYSWTNFNLLIYNFFNWITDKFLQLNDIFF